MNKISVNKVINNLTRIKKALQKDIEKRFIHESLIWIANRANAILEQRTTGYHSSNAREWEYTYDQATHSGRLENKDMNSAAIEFGIGRYGKNFQSNNSSAARSAGWEWDVPSQYKDDNGCWVFKDKNGNLIGLRTIINENGQKQQERYFNGYQGKSFLFDAFIEYKDKEIYKEIYQKAFDNIIPNVIIK